MNMKKLYETPVCELLSVSGEDILTVSYDNMANASGHDDWWNNDDIIV